MTAPGKNTSATTPSPPTLAERCAELAATTDPVRRERLEKEIGELCTGLETRRRRANVFQTETMSFHVGWLGIVLLLLYMAAFGGTTTYTLLKIWPPDSVAVAPRDQTPGPAQPTSAAPTPPAPGRAAPGAAAAPSAVTACSVREPCTDTVVVFQVGRILPGLTFDFRPPREGRRLIFVALFAGGVGAFLSSLLSLATYIGNRELTRSWAIWYLARPPAGMILALLVYFILRGGLLTPAASVNVLSPYGVAAFSGLIGMFVRQATDKLRDIAEAMFTSRVNQERAEGVHTPAASPTNLAAEVGASKVDSGSSTGERADR